MQKLEIAVVAYKYDPVLCVLLQQMTLYFFDPRVGPKWPPTLLLFLFLFLLVLLLSAGHVAKGVDIGIYTPKISPSKLFMG